MSSRLEELFEKQKKLNEQIALEEAKEAAEKAISAIGTDLASTVSKTAKDKGIDIAVLHGKFFALSVEDGKLTVELTAKARKSSGNGNGHSNGNGNGQYEYFLADGKGPFESVQKAMDEMGIPASDRPAHNRYDRLSADWQKKISRKPKASQPAAS